MSRGGATSLAVRKSFHADAACVVERAAAPLLGVPAYGVFCNGYVCDDSPGSPRRCGSGAGGEEADVAGAAGLSRCGGWQQASCPSPMRVPEEAGIEGSLLGGSSPSPACPTRASRGTDGDSRCVEFELSWLSTKPSTVIT